MVVDFAGSQQAGKGGDIQVIIAGRVELEGLSGDDQAGGRRLAIGNGPLQGEEGLAQAVAGPGLGLFGPQQPGQRLAAVGPVGFDGQVGQQGPHLVVFKGGDRLPGQDHLKGAQEGK